MIWDSLEIITSRECSENSLNLSRLKCKMTGDLERPRQISDVLGGQRSRNVTRARGVRARLRLALVPGQGGIERERVKCI